MIFGPRTLLFPSLVLLIGTVFSASATNAFADDPFKKTGDDLVKKVPDDPVKNIGGIDDEKPPVAFSDNIRITNACC